MSSSKTSIQTDWFRLYTSRWPRSQPPPRPSCQRGCRSFSTVDVRKHASPTRICTKGSDVGRPHTAESAASRCSASRTSTSRSPSGRGDFTLMRVSRGRSWATLKTTRCGRTKDSAMMSIIMLAMMRSRFPPICPSRGPMSFLMPVISILMLGGSKKKTCCAPKHGSRSMNGASTHDTVPTKLTCETLTSHELNGMFLNLPTIAGFIRNSESDVNSTSTSTCRPLISSHCLT
mmetsp:Transcript_118597/g.336238  ORF Transcript_118597/g.336238 Transcript_118597/m.336238 type:complete len:232 (-) Transcript_118597:204-899(-)